MYCASHIVLYRYRSSEVQGTKCFTRCGAFILVDTACYTPPSIKSSCFALRRTLLTALDRLGIYLKHHHTLTHPSPIHRNRTRHKWRHYSRSSHDPPVPRHPRTLPHKTCTYQNGCHQSTSGGSNIQHPARGNLEKLIYPQNPCTMGKRRRVDQLPALKSENRRAVSSAGIERNTESRVKSLRILIMGPCR